MITLLRHPLLLVVSAPSGAGKTTLCDRLIREFDDLVYSVSCTTRAPREGEVDGKSYFFLSPEAFEARVAAGDFLEHAVVHGHWYGTLKQTVRDAMDRGRDVLMDIDVQGAEQIRARARRGEPAWLRSVYVDLFIAPPSLRELQLRLWGRGKDDATVIERRLEVAGAEMERWREYRYVVVNDRLDESYDALRSILLAERRRTQRLSIPPSEPQ